MKISKLGERRIVDYILQRIEAPPGSSLQKGDDAAAPVLSGNILTCVDMFVSKTDMPASMSMRQAGKKAVTMTVSDLVSKGGRPLFYLVSLGLPLELEFSEFQNLWAGVEEAARHYGGKIIAGDTNESSDLVIDTFIIGTATKTTGRKGAKPGDILAVTGNFGRTAAGLKILKDKRSTVGFEDLVSSVLEPVARLREGLALADLGGVTSSTDSSDGLARSLHELSRASGVGFRVERPPVDPGAQEFARLSDSDLFEMVFYGGEEYELVFTLDKDMLLHADESMRRVSGRIIPIGRATPIEDGLRAIWQGSEVAIEDLGWEHFHI